MLDAARANLLTTAINDAFAGIGKGPPTAMPRGSKNNTEPLAFEVLVSKRLAKLAAAREALAIRDAIKAGVMFDHKDDPLPEGTSKVVYDGDVVRIDLKVTGGRDGIDHDAYVADLEKAGVAPALLKRLAAKHATMSACPHSFTPSLVTR